MSVRIEVTNEVNEKNGIGKNGQPYRITEQVAYLHKPGERYPTKIKVRVPDNQPRGYEPGDYELDLAQSLYVGRFGALEVSPVLVKVGAKKAA